MVGEKASILGTITISCKSTFSHVEEHPLGQSILFSVSKQKLKGIQKPVQKSQGAGCCLG